MNGFMSAMKSTLNDEFNVSVTENGAVGYRTTGKELLDLNFAVASLRKASPNDIENRFVEIDGYGLFHIKVYLVYCSLMWSMT